MRDQKENIFERTIEFAGWMEIILSPFIINCILGGIVYISFDSLMSLIICILIIIIGIFIGIKLANKIYKSKEGTAHFVSRIRATPELDEDLNKNK